MVFKEAPEILYTGINRVLGKPRDLEKNVEDQMNFDIDTDISIPIKETNEYAEKNPLPVQVNVSNSQLYKFPIECSEIKCFNSSECSQFCSEKPRDFPRKDRRNEEESQ